MYEIKVTMLHSKSQKPDIKSYYKSPFHTRKSVLKRAIFAGGLFHCNFKIGKIYQFTTISRLYVIYCEF